MALNPSQVKSRQAGVHADGGGLYLIVRDSGERIWGFECWWRADPDSAGLKPEDHEEIETSKRLLRGLLREAKRGSRPR